MRFPQIKVELGSIVIRAKIDAGLSLYACKRADETSRYKLVFTKLRHSVQLKPLEILRWERQDSFKWQAVEWNEGDISPKGDAILDVLQSRFSGVATAKELIGASGLSSATFYRQVGPLESCGKITRDGNLYRLDPGLRTSHSEDEA